MFNYRAFRNGPIENLHAGKSSELLSDRELNSFAPPCRVIGIYLTGLTLGTSTSERTG